MILFLNVLKQKKVPSISDSKNAVYNQQKNNHHSSLTYPQDPGTGFVQTNPTREVVLLQCGQAAGGLNPDTGGAYTVGK
jgi:hypothetical protein